MVSTDPDTSNLPRRRHPKATRLDWLTSARDILVSEGVAEVKVLTLSARLGISRSSFYWYFESRADLLNALLHEWEARNTQGIVQKCGLPAECIAEAVCNFFACFFDPELFDPGLDFAVREWARRDGDVRAKIDEADGVRLVALRDLFVRHGYAADDADVRARIVYYMQLGYHALDVRETMDVRMARIAGYLDGFTGQSPSPETVSRFQQQAMALQRS
ncbi:MAG: TetR/AcrR family transcriptional regulator [Pseudomonadota bacterium]